MNRTLSAQSTELTTAHIDTTHDLRIAKLSILALLIPVLFNLGPLFMTTARFAYLLLVPYLLANLAMGRLGGFRKVDACVFLFLIWIALSIARNNPAALVTFVGSNAALFLGGYLTARCYIRSASDFVRLYKFLAICILVLTPLAIFESISTQAPIPRLIEKLPGIFSRIDVNYERRFGLDRAQVVFDHPIHWGLFTSLGFAMVLTGFRTFWSAHKRLLLGFFIGVACFTSVSSGPFLAVIAQAMLLLYWRLFRSVPYHWPALIIIGVLSYIVLDILSDRPAYYAIASRLAFNASTANVRMVLLDFGMDQIGKTPVWGIGYNDWGLPPWMTGSLDNYWLLTALVYGIPAFVFLASAFAYPMIKASRQDFSHSQLLQDTRRAWMISMSGLILTLATVAVWGEMSSLVFFLMGSGVFFGYIPKEDMDQGHIPTPTTHRSTEMVFTRFPAGKTPQDAPASATTEQTDLRKPQYARTL